MAKKPKLVRRSFTLPPQFDDDLAYIAGRLGVTKSALLAEFASEPLHAMRELVAEVPENPDEVELVRMRGKSEAIVRERIEKLQRMQDDLFSH